MAGAENRTGNVVRGTVRATRGIPDLSTLNEVATGLKSAELRVLDVLTDQSAVDVEFEAKITIPPTPTAINILQDWCKQSRELGLFLKLNASKNRKALLIPKHITALHSLEFGILDDNGHFRVPGPCSSISQAPELAAAGLIRQATNDSFVCEATSSMNLLSLQPKYSPELRAQFEHDVEVLTILLKCGSETYRLEFRYKNFERSIYVDFNETGSGDACLYLTYLYAPRIFRLQKGTPKPGIFELLENHDFDYRQWERSDHIGTFWSRDTVGKSSVIRLKFPLATRNPKDTLSFMPFMQRLEMSGFFALYGHVQMSSLQMETFDPPFANFGVRYAWESLRSRGYAVEQKMTRSWAHEISADEADDLAKTEKALFAAASAADKNPRIDVQTEYHKARQEVVASHSDIDDLPDHYSYFRRVVLTPTRLLLLQPQPSLENRVVRQYGGPEFFIRLSFRDEDFERLISPHPKAIDNLLETRFLFQMTDGIDISGCRFDFLGASNSQLRDHGMWLYNAHDGCTAETIRNATGDIHKILCVASYMARLGQVFSGSMQPSVELVSHIVHTDEDIQRNEYIFTDGIGRISPPLAKKIARSLNYDVVPSAFQIRYAGYKGVLAIDPQLGDRDRIIFRESMRKFLSEQRTIEVVGKSAPYRLHTNKQVLTLMEDLSVDPQYVLGLQQNMLHELTEMFWDESAALSTLQQTQPGYSLKALQDAGVKLTKEAFFQSMLQVLHKHHTEELVKRTRIRIPADKGRIMMGVVDEYACLKEDEVFVQYSRDLEHPACALSGNTISKADILKAEVVITKNPCFHPGDLRKYKAVDRAELHHLVDCIVFPTTSRRPIPDMISGSDLDGDMYFVCWDRNLIPTEKNKKPMDFHKVSSKEVSERVDTADLLQFVVQFVHYNDVGRIANAHLAQADQEVRGIFSPTCLKLCGLHSHAVDYPKTGYRGQMHEFSSLRPRVYPDFMMKTDKETYPSQNLLGQLFRQANAYRLKQFYQADDKVVPDDDIIRRSTKLAPAVVSDARKEQDRYSNLVRGVMNMFGVKSEAEVSAGVLLEISHDMQGQRNEELQVTKYIRLKMKGIQKATRKRFFEEFGGEDVAMRDDNLREVVCEKAAIWYYVTYDAEERREAENTGRHISLGFPWVVHDALLHIKETAHPRGNVLHASPQMNESQDVARIQNSVNSFCETAEIHWMQKFNDRRCQVADLLDKQGKPNESPTLQDDLQEVSDLELLLFQNILLFNPEGTSCTTWVAPVADNHRESACFSLLPHNGCGRLEFQDRNLKFYIYPETDKHSWRSFVKEVRDLVLKQPHMLLTLLLLKEVTNSPTVLGDVSQVKVGSTDAILITSLLALHTNKESLATGACAQTAAEAVDTPTHLPKQMRFHNNQQMEFFLETLSLLTNKTVIQELGETLTSRFGAKICPQMDHSILDSFRNGLKKAHTQILTTKSIWHLVNTKPQSLNSKTTTILRGFAYLMSVREAESFASDKLSTFSGAMVSCRIKQLKNASAFVVEVFGTNEQQVKIQSWIAETVSQPQNIQITTVRTDVVDPFVRQLFMQGADSTAKARFVTYRGERNLGQERKKLLTFNVIKASKEDFLSARFCDTINTVFNNLKEHYIPFLHGDLQFNIVFGSIFVTTPSYSPKDEIDVATLEHQANKPNPNFTRAKSSRGNGFGGGDPQATPYDPQWLNTSWVPNNIPDDAVSRVMEHAKSLGFLLDNTHSVYKCGLHETNVKSKTKHGASIYLDEDLKFSRFMYRDVPWTQISVKRPHFYRQNVPLPCTDLRFALKSRRNVRPGALHPDDPLYRIIESGRFLERCHSGKLKVLSPCNGECGLQIDFAREMRRQVYDCPKESDSPAAGMSLCITTVIEHKHPDYRTGVLRTTSKGKVEVQLNCSGNDWVKQTKEKIQFQAQTLWRLANSFVSGIDASDDCYR